MIDLNKRIPIKEQDPKIRATNFDEVCLGYSEDQAKLEANRCLECKNPQCVKGCPVQIDIPSFIKEIKNGNPINAYNIIKKSSALLLGKINV